MVRTDIVVMLVIFVAAFAQMIPAAIAKWFPPRMGKIPQVYLALYNTRIVPKHVFRDAIERHWQEQADLEIYKEYGVQP